MGVGITYASTPTGTQFHANDNFARFVIGPVGSGKTTMGLLELLLRGLKQKPNLAGVRKTRGLVIRNSFPELRSTTIPSYLSWYREICEITYGSPITSRINLPLPDGTTLEQEIFFIGLDDEQSAKKLFSMELTFAFLDEFIFIPDHILDILSARVGRYPEIRSGVKPTFYGYWGTSNPCSVEHWYYKLSEEKRPEGFSFYNQPPGLLVDDKGNYYTNPEAENLDYLPDGYYDRQAIGKDKDYIKVYLMGQYGQLRSGKPVYPQYNDDIHFVDKEYIPSKHLPIVVGIDVGLHGNAAVFTQLLKTGQVVAFDELFFEDLSITEFAKTKLVPHINNNYFKYNISLVTDPAATHRSSSNKKSAFDIFKYQHKLPVEIAVTNDILARIEAVVDFLIMQDGLILTPGVPWLRRGMISEYKYKELKGTMGTKFHDKPDKNEYSHVADAFQYACLKHKRIRLNTRRRVKPKYDSIGDSHAGY